MRIVAAVFADFAETPSGGPSQLGTELHGQTILARTLHRVAQIEGLAGRYLFVHPRDEEPARQALSASGLVGEFDLLPLDTAKRNRRALLRAARKWNLDSWRGGLMGTSWFDEFVDANAIAIALDHTKSHAIFCFEGHQPVLDPAIASAMIRHAEAHQHESKITFTQAPPGLAGIVVRAEAVRDLLEMNIPLGLVLSYRPELAQYDPIIHSACYHVAPEIVQTRARLTGDARRSRELLELALRELGNAPSAFDLCRWIDAPGHDRAGPLPVEVELELTTNASLPSTTLRPRGERVPSRHLNDLEAVGHLAQQLARYDDRLIFLGGHGDPLRHPQFADICHILRDQGVYGIGVATPLLDLTSQNFEALLANQIDVLEVQLDAHSPETYQRVHGLDGFARVRENIDRVESTRRQQGKPQPIVACSLTRCAATISEIEGFFDDWICNIGTSVIRGFNDYCGTFPTDTLLSTVPSERQPCCRLETRLMLLADGTVALCAQDFRGEHPLGNWTRQDLQDIWTGETLKRVRRAHASLNLEPVPMCQKCNEWNRP